jgi:ribonuclease HI
MNGTWPIPDTLYDALHQCFNIQRVIHCNPINLPLRAKTYISHDPRDTRFSATPYTHTAWPGTSLAIPEYTPYRLKQALEQAIYSAHAHRHTSPSSHILILPNWEHSPYLARNLHSTYAQKLTSIPYYPIYNKQPNTSKPKLNIYLIANEKALALLNHQHITNTLRLALTKLTGKTTPITLNLKQKDPRHIDSHTTYTEQYPYTQNPQYTPLPLIYKKFHAAWDPKRFVYTDGSQKRGNPTLGAAIVNPVTGITYHIEIKSQEERHTINRAELAAITLALDLHKEESTLQILTDSAFSINTLRNYAINPLRYTHHTHKDLLAHTNNIIQNRDTKGYTTHIGKVKSHTGVTYNDAADTGACAVVDGDILPDIIFTQADPPPRRPTNVALHTKPRHNQSP